MDSESLRCSPAPPPMGRHKSLHPDETTEATHSKRQHHSVPHEPVKAAVKPVTTEARNSVARGWTMSAATAGLKKSSMVPIAYSHHAKGKVSESARFGQYVPATMTMANRGVASTVSYREMADKRTAIKDDVCSVDITPAAGKTTTAGGGDTDIGVVVQMPEEERSVEGSTDSQAVMQIKELKAQLDLQLKVSGRQDCYPHSERNFTCSIIDQAKASLF